MDDTLINFGSEIKSLGETEDGAMKFGAWLVLYGDPQNTDASNLRDYFTKSTDFDFEDGDKTTVYWNHGLDPELKRRKLGTANLYKKDAGVWMEGILKARDEYEAKIQEMIKAGKLGASSGVPSHLVERKSVNGAHEILLWPLGKDASLTHTPAEWRTTAHALKSLEEATELPSFSELKAVTTDDALPYPQQQTDVVGYPTRQPVLAASDSDYSRCVACSAHNAPDATKCAECGALIPESARKSVDDLLDEIKKYDPRQPRDDLGRWSSGPGGGISIGHAIHVMKAEGITDPKHHETVKQAIESGTHKSREAVLAHIDSIHKLNGTTPPQSKYGGGEATAASTPASVSAGSGTPPKVMSRDELAKAIGDTPEGITKEIEGAQNGWNGPGAKDMADHATQIANIQKNRNNKDWEAIGHSFLHHALEGKDDAFAAAAKEEYQKFVLRQKTNEEFRQMRAQGMADDDIRKKLAAKYPHIAEQMSRKSIEDEDTPETELPPAGIGFEAHSSAVLAAVEEFVERSHGLKTVRCERDGRRWSAEKYQSLTELATGLSQAADAIKAMAEAHAPKRDATPDALKALAQIELTRARLNGVSV